MVILDISLLYFIFKINLFYIVDLFKLSWYFEKLVSNNSQQQN